MIEAASVVTWPCTQHRQRSPEDLSVSRLVVNQHAACAIIPEKDDDDSDGLGHHHPHVMIRYARPQPHFQKDYDHFGQAQSYDPNHENHHEFDTDMVLGRGEDVFAGSEEVHDGPQRIAGRHSEREIGGRMGQQMAEDDEHHVIDEGREDADDAEPNGLLQCGMPEDFRGQCRCRDLFCGWQVSLPAGILLACMASGSPIYRPYSSARSLL